MRRRSLSRHMELELEHAARVRAGRAEPLSDHDPVAGCSCPRCVLLAVARMGGVSPGAVDVCVTMILPELAAKIPLERQAVAERLRSEWQSSTGEEFPSAALLAALAARVPGARKDPAPVADDRGPLPVEQARSVSILNVAARLGVPLRQSGNRYRGQCPFHIGKSGMSFSVDAERGLWYCFSCSIGGDTIDLLARAEDLDFPTAVKELAHA